MPNLSIKNVPEAVVHQLRERASANHRSLQGELMALVCAAAGSGAADTRREPGAAAQGKRIEEIAAAHRQRRPEPIDADIDAVAILREERDAR